MITVIDLEAFKTLDDAYQELVGKYYPEKPKTPTISEKDMLDINKIQEYLFAVQNYNYILIERENKLKEFQIKDTQFQEAFKKYIIKHIRASTLLEKYQDNLFRKAWEYGHADGYQEVYYQALSLMEIFL